MYRSIYQDKISARLRPWIRTWTAMHAPFVIIFLLLHYYCARKLSFLRQLSYIYYSNKYSFKRHIITGWVIWNIYGLAQYPSSLQGLRDCREKQRQTYISFGVINAEQSSINKISLIKKIWQHARKIYVYGDTNNK